jgi:hypothetical protein
MRVVFHVEYEKDRRIEGSKWIGLKGVGKEMTLKNYRVSVESGKVKRKRRANT